MSGLSTILSRLARCLRQTVSLRARVIVFPDRMAFPILSLACCVSEQRLVRGDLVLTVPDHSVVTTYRCRTQLDGLSQRAIAQIHLRRQFDPARARSPCTFKGDQCVCCL